MKPADKHRLLIVGDSISLGVAELRGNEIAGYVNTTYVNILRSRLANMVLQVEADIHRTTTATLKFLPEALRQHTPDCVLLMLGGNDADVEWKRFIISDGRVLRNRIPLADYTRNLQQLAELIRNAGAKPILTDMPNHCLAKRGPYLSALANKDVAAMIAAHGGQPTSDAGLDRYRQAAEEVAARTGSAFIAYGRELNHHPLEAMSGPDGVHPSAEAHAIIGDVIATQMDRLTCRDKITVPHRAH